MRSQVLPCLAIIGFSICTVFAAQDKPSQPVVTQGDVARFLDDYATRASRLGFSGVLLVEKSGQIILDKGYGLADIGRDIPNSTSTIFYLASLSKQYTAAAT
jgi:CubicO group peptidase (beta-lactamase class C family)